MRPHARAASRSLVVLLAGALGLTACTAELEDDEAEPTERDAAELGSPPKGARFSELWGKKGEKWSPKSRLPDFSFAGYHGGNAKIPGGQPKVIDASKHGAKPNDGKSDGAAIERILGDAPKGSVVYLPKGKYEISNPIRIKRGHVVLRGAGAGPGGTVLAITRGLKAVDGYDAKSVSYSGGFIEVIGDGSNKELARVTGNTPRGEHWIEVSSTADLAAGDLVTLQFAEVDGDFLRHVYAEQFSLSKTSEISDEFDMPVVIDKVEKGRVRLLQPLRLDVRKDWKPRLVANASLREVGIEKLTFDFEHRPYGGHHDEDGMNGVHMMRAVNSWVRDVAFEDADNGVKVERGKWVTVEDVKFRGRTGHHGISVARSADVLVQGVHFANEFWHELTVVYGTHGAVFRDVSADDDVTMHLDHHGEFPFENLFTNFRGVKRWSWMSGGGDPKKGPHAGARGTFWNLSGLTPPKRYDDLDGDPDGETENLPWRSLQTTIVGKTADAKTDRSKKGLWVEDLAKLWPEDLYRAQLARRRAEGN